METNDNVLVLENQQTEACDNAETVSNLENCFNLKKGDIIFCVCTVIFSVFTSIFGIFGGFALGYLISCVLLFSLFFVYLAKGAKIRLFPILCGVLSLANAAVFICTSNSSVRFYGVLVSAILGLVCFDGLVLGPSKGNGKTFGIFCTAICTVGNIGLSFKSIFSSSNGNKKSVGKAFVGIGLAIPVLFVIVPLLIASDDAFSGMMDNIFGDIFDNIFEANFGVAIAIFLVTYAFSLKNRRVKRVGDGRVSGLENVYVVSFLSVINLCYLLYLFSQLAYFFSAFKGFLPNGDITYAEYARKGFFEMCAIAVINLLIVSMTLIFAKTKDGKVYNTVKFLLTFMTVFTLIIISTAISKMVLYISEYGMTVLRITTGSFMVFLAIVFLSVLLRIFFKEINIAKTAIITAGCILIALGTVNVNAVCAQYNYESYLSKRLDSIDVNALYELGDEGIPYIVELTDDDNYNVRETAKQYLARAMKYDYFYNLDQVSDLIVSNLKEKEVENTFERFSIPKAKAYESIYNFIEENPNFSYYLKENNNYYTY